MCPCAYVITQRVCPCVGRFGCVLLPSMRLSCFFFFFSSRRRHTISDRDWSSDVCSSDLLAPLAGEAPHLRLHFGDQVFEAGQVCPRLLQASLVALLPAAVEPDSRRFFRSEERRVGKEGRSRGSPYHLKKKKKTERDTKSA